jgi:hypothetical protein
VHGRVFGNREIIASEIGGNYRPGKDKIVRPYKWVGVFRHLHKSKADVEFAAITGKDQRTGRRYFEGEHEPPGAIVAAIVAELFKREGDQ